MDTKFDLQILRLILQAPTQQSGLLQAGLWAQLAGSGIASLLTKEGVHYLSTQPSYFVKSILIERFECLLSFPVGAAVSDV